LREPALVVGLERRAQRPCVFVDAFGLVQDFLRGLFHAGDRCAELAGRAREARVLAVADERGKFAPIARDGVLHGGKLARKLIVAEVVPAATEQDLPQEAGLEEAVSFGKGCYLGQEAMAKVRNLGHPRRALRHLHADGPVSAGDPLRARRDLQAEERRRHAGEGRRH